MSWKAKRYHRYRPPNTSKHHIPPKHPAGQNFTLRVSNVDHKAYHTLFSNAGSFEQCVQILWKYWWLPYYQATDNPAPDVQRIVERVKEAA